MKLVTFNIRYDCGTDGINNFSCVVWRYTCCHTNSNTFSTIDKQVWNTCRQYYRFFFCLIKVWLKINDIFI